MWLFTPCGFFSAVCARHTTGKLKGKPDPDRIMVRARVRQHLENLLARFPVLLAGVEIQTSAGTDYRFRFFVSKATWTMVVAALTEAIDFDNFKSACHDQPVEALGAGYNRALMQVWTVMHGLQPTR